MQLQYRLLHSEIDNSRLNDTVIEREKLKKLAIKNSLNVFSVNTPSINNKCDAIDLIRTINVLFFSNYVQ